MSTDSPFPGKRSVRTVLIVDDHPLVRRGLSELIGSEPDLEVCGEAEDTTEALRLAKTVRPDVAVIDLTLKGGHGIELIEEIRARNLPIKMLVSSMHDESLYAERVLRAGAMGYISKQESTETVVDAIHQILRGTIYLSPRMTNRILHGVVGSESLKHDPIEGLSNRELEVFEMIGRGLTTQEIARALDLSPKTIEAHREKIKAKLNVRTGTELSRRAVQWVLEGG